MPRATTQQKPSFFARLHSAQKILICIVIAVIAYFIANIQHLDVLTHLMIGWDVFSFCLVVMSWITFSITTSQHIREQAKVQDSSRVLIFITILISTFASFLAVLLLIISKKDFKSTETFHTIIAIAGMLFSWFLIHTIFTYRYAHIFYGDDEEKPNTHAGGLDFPDDKKPDYLDFAYFSFVLGMTFQVSDVQVTSKRLRRFALLHGILSFIFNTVMIALTINIIAGLSG
ncbi:MAG: DUF1345 domain-containing protein [Bacteroidota bacterium]|nr:DUF1345 domain-containing protein [Bacteroidota bacterium]MDQ6904663.1 DUF1345 domain-containing protein [Bacteroidota bacterium]